MTQTSNNDVFSITNKPVMILVGDQWKRAEQVKALDSMGRIEVRFNGKTHMMPPHWVKGIDDA